MPVQFEEQYNTQTYQEEKKGIIGFLLKKNVVANRKQANYVLIGIIILAILISFIVFSKAKNSNVQVELSQEELVELQRMGAL